VPYFLSVFSGSSKNFVLQNHSLRSIWLDQIRTSPKLRYCSALTIFLSWSFDRDGDFLTKCENVCNELSASSLLPMLYFSTLMSFLIGCKCSSRQQHNFAIDLNDDEWGFSVKFWFYLPPQVNQDIYPVGTYSNLSLLILVFLLTDLARYKPIIILEGFAGVATYCLIIWGHDLPSMQVGFFLFSLSSFENKGMSLF
jgi:hypothetical protein